MVSEELLMIERLGIGGTAFYLVYILLKDMIKKSFAQADVILELAKSTINENTKALQKMQESLSQHIIQKDVFIEEMKDCRKLRDEKFDKLNNMMHTKY